jgi:hypothetical protein
MIEIKTLYVPLTKVLTSDKELQVVIRDYYNNRIIICCEKKFTAAN